MSYIGRGLQSGAFRQLDDISSGFDGSDTTHTMQVNSTNVTVGDVNQILLSLGGVIQKPGTDFTVSSSTLTFTTAPAANTSFFAILLGSDNGGTVTPTDSSVTPGKLSFTDGATIKFGTDSEVELTHNADKGLILKHTATGDDKPVSLTLQTGETDIAADDVIGKIEFQAPDEGTGTDAVLVAAGIQAVSEGDFSSSSNATELQFLTGNSAAATAKMVLTSGGSNNEGRLGVGTTHPASGAGLDAFIEVQGGDPGIVLRDDTASDAVELYNAGGTFVAYTGSADALKIDSTGAVTKPLQPAFSVHKNGTDQSNMAIATTTVTWTHERFDQNADFNLTDNNFVAPVTGKYFLNFMFRLEAVDTGAAYYVVSIVTSNASYRYIIDPNFSADLNYFKIQVTVLADMDASDTAHIEFVQNSGTVQTDIDGDATETFFMGHLVA
jgi:hypothetical protein